MKDIKNKKLIIAMIIVTLICLGVAGATYAYLTLATNVTNAAYNLGTHCFTIDYNINNVDGSQDITGTLFPSGTVTGGLTGRVGMKINNNCDINGIGTIKLHINGNNATSATLTSSANSYCEDRSTLEPMTGNDAPSTKADCDTAGGRWQSYGESYCENNNTLERMIGYTNSSSCTSNGGTWITCSNNNCNVSPLKYAIYDNSAGTGTPLDKGTIVSTDIGDDISIYDGFTISKTQDYTYYYIFIWLDGYLTNASYVNLPFSGYITAEAVQ